MAIELRYAIDEENSAWRIVDGEAVIINAETTYYYGLNESATRIWQSLLDADLSASEIAVQVAPVYSRPPQEIVDGIRALLGQLAEAELVKGDGEHEIASALDTEGTAGAPEAPWVEPAMTRYDTLEDLIVCGE